MRKVFIFCFIFVFHSAASASLYHILGVLSYSPLEQITKNYERIKERIHPSNNSNSRESRERFQELEESYTVLSDPIRRAEYDKHLKNNPLDKISNFYKLLGVLSDSSAEQMTRAYRELRAPVHPDRQNNSKESNDRFKELQKAYRTLANPVLRSKHDTALRESYIIPYSRERNKRKAEELRETTPDRKDQTEAGKAGNEGLDKKAQFTASAEQGSEEGEIAAWNKQVFELAKGLEKDGGQEDRAEAIVWYRTLAQENHLEAAWHLALLLEETDPVEALYRYEQVQILDAGDELAREAVFRQAQIYQVGIHEGGKEIFSPEPDRALELYEEAFSLGVPAEEIAKLYDRNRDFPEALKWHHRGGNGSSQQLINKTPSTKYKMETQIIGNTEIHLAILSKKQVTSLYAHETQIIDMIRVILKGNEDIDLNTQNSQGKTALMLAIEEGYSFVIKFLLKSGADPNIPDQDGNNALHTLIISKEPFKELPRDRDYRILSLAKAMVKKKGAHLLSTRNNKGELPLHLAMRTNLTRATTSIQWIIKRGGADTLEEEEFDSLIQEAINRKQIKAIRLLKERKAIKYSDPSRPPTKNRFLNFLNNLCRMGFTQKIENQ